MTNFNESLSAKILGIDTSRDMGGIVRFTHCTYSQMKALLQNDQIDLSDQHNDSPTVREFLSFCDEHNCHDDIEFGGYLVAQRREDARVSFDSVSLQVHKNFDVIASFVNRFHGADEFDLGTFFAKAWWD